jgi:hypothetical protein
VCKIFCLQSRKFGVLKLETDSRDLHQQGDDTEIGTEGKIAGTGVVTDITVSTETAQFCMLGVCLPFLDERLPILGSPV